MSDLKLITYQVDTQQDKVSTVPGVPEKVPTFENSSYQEYNTDLNDLNYI